MSEAYFNEHKKHLSEQILKKADGAYGTVVKLKRQRTELQHRGQDLSEKKLAYLTQAVHKAHDYYQRALEYALENEDEVGEWLTCKIMNSLSISYQQLGKRGEAKASRARYHEYVQARLAKWELEDHLVNLIDLVDFLSDEKIKRLVLLNPYVANRAMAQIEAEHPMFHLKAEDIMEGDRFLQAVYKPRVTETDKLFSRVPAANVADLASVLVTEALDSDNLVCSRVEQYVRFYDLLLRWPMRDSLHRVLLGLTQEKLAEAG
jgi:hypothetical protein